MIIFIEKRKTENIVGIRSKSTLISNIFVPIPNRWFNITIKLHFFLPNFWNETDNWPAQLKKIFFIHKKSNNIFSFSLIQENEKHIEWNLEREKQKKWDDVFEYRVRCSCSCIHTCFVAHSETQPSFLILPFVYIFTLFYSSMCQASFAFFSHSHSILLC